MAEKPFGQILVEQNMISSDQLKSALDRQQKEKGKYLGQILREMGIPQEKINGALDRSRKRKPLGEILIDLKVINRQQLEAALARQKELQKSEGRKKPLGTLLIEMGVMTRAAYWHALSKHFNLPIIHLGSFPGQAMQKVLGEKYASKNKIIVLENGVDTVKLALAEPTGPILDELKRVLPPGKKIEIYMASPHEIESLLRKTPDPFAINKYR